MTVALVVGISLLLGAREWGEILWPVCAMLDVLFAVDLGSPTVEHFVPAREVGCNSMVHFALLRAISMPVCCLASTCASDLISSMVRTPFLRAREWTAILQAVPDASADSLAADHLTNAPKALWRS